MSDPFKGQPSNKQPAQPQSKPVKLAEYSNPKSHSSKPVNPQEGGLSSKLPKK